MIDSLRPRQFAPKKKVYCKEILTSDQPFVTSSKIFFIVTLECFYFSLTLLLYFIFVCLFALFGGHTIKSFFLLP